MTEAHIPLGPLRLALVDLTGAPDDHLVRIEITKDRVFIHAWGANPEKGLVAIRKTFEIERRKEIIGKTIGIPEAKKDREEIKQRTGLLDGRPRDLRLLAKLEKEGKIKEKGANNEFHEETPPDWVPPQLIRMWDKCTPEQRKAMKEGLELQQTRAGQFSMEEGGGAETTERPIMRGECISCGARIYAKDKPELDAWLKEHEDGACKVKKDDSVERNRDPVPGPDREDP